MRVAVTGASGFLGWHVLCRAFLDGIQVVSVGRDTLTDPDLLAAVLDGCDAVIHCAGASRGADQHIEASHVPLAKVLAAALERTAHPPRVVYANSVQHRRDTVYGKAKRLARDVLTVATPNGMSDVILANLYGEHGRPFHNSFVATFSHQLVHGGTPTVVDDKEVELIDGQDTAAIMLAEAGRTGHRQREPAGDLAVVSDVLVELRRFDDMYRRAGEVPDLSDLFTLRLFNAYRSHLPPRVQILTLHTDRRGMLVEAARVGSGGQVFASITLPGQVRGEHVHARRVERFAVLDGTVQVGLRRMWHQPAMVLRLGPGQAVDMPTLWPHNLVNVGDEAASVVFWSSHGDGDTWPCPVDRSDDGP